MLGGIHNNQVSWDKASNIWTEYYAHLVTLNEQAELKLLQCDDCTSLPGSVSGLGRSLKKYLAVPRMMLLLKASLVFIGLQQQKVIC